MKGKFLDIYRCIVGPEYGFTGEGNEQWYYVLALIMNVMLIDWLKPEALVLFTILAIIHYVTVCIYGFFDLSESNVIVSYAYFAIHMVLLLVAIWASFQWTIITAAIVIVSFLLAPNCTGNNIFKRRTTVRDKTPLIFNTIIFVAFMVVDFLLPVKLWIKLLIIVSVVIIHPIIDWFEGECIIISDVTSDALGNIRDHICRK